jgi:hypothetical protein
MVSGIIDPIFERSILNCVLTSGNGSIFILMIWIDNDGNQSKDIFNFKINPENPTPALIPLCYRNPEHT